jgi:hypothetical protein
VWRGGLPSFLPTTPHSGGTASAQPSQPRHNWTRVKRGQQKGEWLSMQIGLTTLALGGSLVVVPKVTAGLNPNAWLCGHAVAKFSTLVAFDSNVWLCKRDRRSHAEEPRHETGSDMCEPGHEMERDMNKPRPDGMWHVNHDTRWQGGMSGEPQRRG